MATVKMTGIGAALLLASLLLPMQGAQAQTDDTSASSVAVSAPVLLQGQTTPRTYSSEESAEINSSGGDPALLDYWTPERMASSVPDEVAVSANAEVSRQPEVPERPLAVASKPTGPLVPDSSSGPGATQSTAPITNFSRTIGKLYYRNLTTGEDTWCSAAAVNSNSKRVVITASHCLHSGKGGRFNGNVVFAPGANGQTNPLGIWQASTLRVSPEWVAGGGRYLDVNTAPAYANDVAFVTLFSGGNNNQRIVDAVGGHGLTYNGGYVFDASVFGYPQNNNGGRTMVGCAGPPTRMDTNFPQRLLLNCNFNGGSSGGPWLDQYNNSTGYGIVRSVTSTERYPEDSENGGPRFDDSTNAMYQASQTDA